MAGRAKKAASNGRAAKPKQPVVPEVLTAQGRANVVIGILSQIQSQRLGVQVQQCANASTDDSILPETRGTGDEMTYAEKYEQLREAEERIIAAYADVVPTIHEIVEAHRAAAS